MTFKDVAGVEEAKEELQEIIEFLKEPQKFQKLGGRIPKGVLMMAPNNRARWALKGDVPFFSISGSDFVGDVCRRRRFGVRDVFEKGKRKVL